jgi:hypothetical protein
VHNLTQEAATIRQIIKENDVKENMRPDVACQEESKNKSMSVIRTIESPADVSFKVLSA